MIERRNKPGLTHQMKFAIPDKLIGEWELRQFYNINSSNIDIEGIRLKASKRFNPKISPSLHYAFSNYCFDPDQPEFWDYQNAIFNFRTSYMKYALHSSNDHRVVELYDEMENQEKILRGWKSSKSPLLPLVHRLMIQQFTFRFGKDLARTFNEKLQEWTHETINDFSPFQSTDPMETPDFNTRATGIPLQAFVVEKMLREIDHCFRISKSDVSKILEKRWKNLPTPPGYNEFENNLNELELVLFGRVTGTCYGVMV